ncbi:MAG: universal stress protein [Armatimonadetes bacterium]|nr:universal stress protein [Armatimonadota bacterium]
MIVESYEDQIILSGPLRSNFWDTIHTAISLALKKSPQGVIINCSGITECTLEGADTFRDIMLFTKSHDARVLVAEVPEQVLFVLKQAPEVRSQLAISSTVEEARQSLFRLHDHEDEPHKKKKKKPVVTGGMQVLVCLTDRGSDSAALEAAIEYANNLQGHLSLVFPLIVPRELPLQSALPEEEGRGAEVLRWAEVEAETNQIPASVKMERGREVAAIIEEAMDETKAERLIVALPSGEESAELAAKLVRSVLPKVRVPIMFVRGAD